MKTNLLISTLLSTGLSGQFLTYGSTCNYGYFCNNRYVQSPNLQGGGIPSVGNTYYLRIIDPAQNRGCGNGPAYFISIIGVQPANFSFINGIGITCTLNVNPILYRGENGHINLFNWNNGAWELNYDIPNNPHLIGLSIYHQVAINFANGIVPPNVVLLSNGLKVTIQ